MKFNCWRWLYYVFLLITRIPFLYVHSHSKVSKSIHIFFYFSCNRRLDTVVLANCYANSHLEILSASKDSYYGSGFCFYLLNLLLNLYHMRNYELVRLQHKQSLKQLYSCFVGSTNFINPQALISALASLGRYSLGPSCL